MFPEVLKTVLEEEVLGSLILRRIPEHRRWFLITVLVGAGGVGGVDMLESGFPRLSIW